MARIKIKQPQINLQSLAEAWGASYVERSKVSEFSGGILHSRTMANMDASGQGIKGRIKIGRKVAYPVDELITWMEARAKYPGHPGKIGSQQEGSNER